MVIIVSQFTMDTFCFANDLVLFEKPQNYVVTIAISTTRKGQKYIGPSVCNANKNDYSFFIMNSRIVMRISGEKAWHPLQENEAIVKKYICQKF